MPGRHDVALLLGEAMRGEGWTGGRMEEQRQRSERRIARKRGRERIREDVGKVLSVSQRWWGDDEWQTVTSESDGDESEGEEALLVSDTSCIHIGCLANRWKDPVTPIYEHARLFSTYTPGYFPVTNNRLHSIHAKHRACQSAVYACPLCLSHMRQHVA